MRLICPNCGAQYEVDSSLIPETGRDVQCSNCGHGWFQHPDDFGTGADLSGEAARAEPPGDADLDAEDGATPPVSIEKTDESSRRGRALDPSVAEVLREEAEREAAARRAEAGGALESQPDLGLDDSEEKIAARSSAARARMSRLRGLDADQPATPARESPHRSDLLPDVDEINSTLRSDEERGESSLLADDLRPKKKARGSRLGLLLVVLICVIGVAVYALAPRIVEAVPQSAPYLTAYLETVNSLRVQVNGWVSAGIDAVRGLISGGE